MTQLDISEAGERLADLIARARAGEEIIISETGKADVRLVAIDRNVPVFEAFKGRVTIADDFDDPLPPELLAEFLK
jgi:prevent-host-death family protein